MATYTAILAAETDPGKPVKSDLMKRFADNHLAVAEGAVGAPKVLDAALDTGTPTTAGITWVGKRTADLAVGAVGSYALLSNQSGVNTVHAPGSTHAAANLRYTDVMSTVGTTVAAGTWQSMGRHETDSTAVIPAASSLRSTLFLRVA